MIKIFTGPDLAELDRRTIQYDAVSQIDLVERAAQVFVFEFKRQYPLHRPVYIFAGPGNNGADALAIARRLIEDNYNVKTFLFNPNGKLSEACRYNRQQLADMYSAGLSEIIDRFEKPSFDPSGVIIDGLFGTGLNRPLEGGFKAVVSLINNSQLEVVAVDIPSGLNDYDNERNDKDAIVKANYTYSFEQPKLAFFFKENACFVGQWIILQIALSLKAKQELTADFYYNTDEDMAHALKPRQRFSSKRDYGHALIVAGSRGRMGAACLAAKACIRSGVGLLTTHVPQSGELALLNHVPESMLSLDINNSFCTEVHFKNYRYEAVGVGPGLGMDSSTQELVSKLLKGTLGPLVIDADALNIIAQNPSWKEILPIYSILTPHMAEMDRLTSESYNDFERLKKARLFARRHSVYVVLKGAYTAICMPSGAVIFNNTGNQGMATAGSGDVLLGIITGLLASGYNPGEASIMGAYIHGLSGDISVGRSSQEALIASDIVDNLGFAFMQLRD